MFGYDGGKIMMMMMMNSLQINLRFNREIWEGRKWGGAKGKREK